MDNKIKIFFSYSSEDKEYIKLLKTFLKSIDKNDCIEYYDYVERNDNSLTSNYAVIYDQISQCNLFISILSSHYLKSALCCWETGLAFRENLINKRKSNFTKLAFLTTENSSSTEFFHLYNNHYYFKKKSFEKLINDINIKYPNFELSRYSISNDLNNLQKETESILIKKIIELNNYSESESKKIKKLIE